MRRVRPCNACYNLREPTDQKSLAGRNAPSEHAERHSTSSRRASFEFAVEIDIASAMLTAIRGQLARDEVDDSQVRSNVPGDFAIDMPFEASAKIQRRYFTTFSTLIPRLRSLVRNVGRLSPRSCAAFA